MLVKVARTGIELPASISLHGRRVFAYPTLEVILLREVRTVLPDTALLDPAVRQVNRVLPLKSEAHAALH
jgi:hypothetical protein